MPEVSYVPGGRTAIVGTYCWALIDAVPDSAVVSEIWPRMEQASKMDVLVASLLRAGLDNVPDFVLLVAAEDRYHLICRGQASATLMTGESAERVDGTGLATWLEYPVASTVERVVLGALPAGSDLQLPASAGVFLASSVAVDLTAPARSRGPRHSRAPDLALAAPGPAPSGPALSAPGLAPSAPAAPPSPIRADAGPPGGGLDDGNGYDFLFGPTQTRTVEGAAIRAPAEGHADPLFPPPPPTVAVPGRSPAAPPGNVARGPAAPGPPAPAGLIDSVPWASEVDQWRSSSVPFAPGSAAAPGDDDGSTVMRGDLLKLATRQAVPDRIGPTVHAMLCPGGHLNPPSHSACRSCGAPLPPQDPVLVPRPVLGVLRLSTGDVITLDRGVVMGRSPRTDFHGDERPHVVKLPNGDGEISRTHLQVILDGWHVLVTDLNSTNGTLMVLPGRDPEQLRPGEPVPIAPGTQIILAVGVDFRYEAAE